MNLARFNRITSYNVCYTKLLRASLAQVAEQQSKHWAELMREKGLEFECITEGPDDGRYSPTLLGTVMANLLRNALHYTNRGQVRLFLEAGGFRVEDSGAGIAQEQHESIFLPFSYNFV